MIEAPHPRRAQHQTGKSDPIDAHLAAIGALRLDMDKLPTPRADGDREALRILLGAREELTITDTRLINRCAPFSSPATRPTANWLAAR